MTKRRVNSRAKGKRIELEVADRLRDLLPDLRRNWMAQSAQGGTDLISDAHPELDIEVKGGKAFNSKMVRGVLEQLLHEGKEQNIKFAIIKPDREDPYVVMPMGDFEDLLTCYLEYTSR